MIEQWTSLCNPGPGVDWNSPQVLEALELNKLRPVDLLNAPELRYIMPRIVEYAERCPVWAGHNIGFDLDLLHLGCHLRRAPDVILDTILIDTVLGPPRESRSLSKVALRRNVEDFDLHTAMGDAMTVGRIIQSYWPHMPDTIEDLREMMHIGRYRRQKELDARDDGKERRVRFPMLDGHDWLAKEPLDRAAH
jgi:DNA polymerase III epsilon subunit-like protein